MFGSKFNEKKLKANLSLVATRLKFLAKKKTDQSLRNRSEIVEYLQKHKLDGARVLAERAICNNYLVEAFELVEWHASLLELRLGLLRRSKHIDNDIKTPVSTLIWATPRLHEHCQELKIVYDQLRAYYGKKFVESCQKNEAGFVCNRLIKRLDVTPPSRVLVEHYIADICRSAGVDFQPDDEVLREPENNISASVPRCCEQSRKCVGVCFSSSRKGSGIVQQSLLPRSLTRYSLHNQDLPNDSKYLSQKQDHLAWQNQLQTNNSDQLEKITEKPPTYEECVSPAFQQILDNADPKSNCTSRSHVGGDLPHSTNSDQVFSSEDELDLLTKRLEKLRTIT